ncbi:hypothetical protein [Prosthecobacter sp.]|jgi:hypothetical protein|uniref:hypothetical protein n=1 Tax=Prosthecobacter sp. TaxID=1965333 RepID=UPI003782FA62
MDESQSLGNNEAENASAPPPGDDKAASQKKGMQLWVRRWLLPSRLGGSFAIASANRQIHGATDENAAGVSGGAVRDMETSATLQDAGRGCR